MAGNISLGDLRAEAQDRADMVGNTLVSIPIWNKYINKSKDALYDLLVSAYGADYYVADPLDIQLISNQERYLLPTDYYKTIKVEYVVDPYNRFPLRRFSPSSSNKASRLYPMSSARFNYTYREMGNYLYFYPIPIGASTIKLWYIPLATNLVADVDELQGFNGFEEYIIIDAAMKAMRKEETDTSDHERDLARITKRLEEMAEIRNLGEAHKILDVARPLNPDNFLGDVFYY